MVSRIFVARHGYRANWTSSVPEPDPPTGIKGDSVLAPKGIAQAKELAIELKGLERKIEKIYSSRFCRCIQTSEIIAEELGLEIYAEMGLGDWYSRQRKTHPVPAPPDALHRYFPRVQAEYQSVSSVDPTGETQQELYSRIKETLEKILTNEGDTNTLLIITHAATAIAIGHILTGNYEADIHTGTCSLSCYSTAKGEQMGNWSAEFTGKATFLSNGEVMNWSFDQPYDPESTTGDLQEEEQAKADDGEEVVSLYVPLDMGIANMMSGVAGRRVLSQLSFQASGLHEDKPLIKVGEDIYRGDWQDITGTELYVTGDGSYLGKTRSRIILEPVQIKSRADGTDGNESQKRTLTQKIQEINLRRAAAQTNAADRSNSTNGPE